MSGEDHNQHRLGEWKLWRVIVLRVPFLAFVFDIMLSFSLLYAFSLLVAPFGIFNLYVPCSLCLLWIGDRQWRLSNLPFAFRGLGVYSADSNIVTSGPAFDNALSTFNSKMKIDLLSNLSEAVAPKIMKKLTYIYFTRVTQTAKSTFSLTTRQMALWKSQIEEHTSDWLRVILISGLGQTMNGRTYECVLFYRLGVLLFTLLKLLEVFRLVRKWVLNLQKNIDLFLKSLLLALAVIRRKVWNLLLRLVNPFEVLNSVDNDVELGTNANLVNNGATSSGSSFMNVDNSSTGTTPIIDKIRKFEELFTNGQAILVDEAGNPLKKLEFLGDYDSEDEVALVDNDMACSLASERVGFGTQSLVDQ
ncbi:hypothetical protein Tco_0903844 [Tanacetum coccineum]